uniref:Arginine/serine-rich splicing factor SCL42 transcript II n=1 Tax=Physcomitrium patens TaxID=3218 RepID=M1HAM8_PHYPA|nr:arginine/serine-rich splicing factor SCL42 transcript II [Physcomitrium patens]
MRGRSPLGHSPPRRSHGGGNRRRSPSPRGGRGGYGRDSTEPSSLLVRNIPRDCSAEDLRIPFERYGVVKDVYLPRDYYTGSLHEEYQYPDVSEVSRSGFKIVKFEF